jgi:hypothetical protein
MTWETANPWAIVDIEARPQVVVTRYESKAMATWYLGYLLAHGAASTQAKLRRGGYGIEENSRKMMAEKVASARRMDYTKGNAKPRTTNVENKGKVTTMPPRGRKGAAVPVEPEEVLEEENGAGLFDHHLTKDLSPTMSTYADWFHANVADIDQLGKDDPARLLALGSTLYPHFQKSPENQAARAERKAARAVAVEPEPEPEPEPVAQPARRGRPSTKAAAAAPAAAPAAKAPARRRGAAPAAAEAPY